jgi:hypothetical protein
MQMRVVRVHCACHPDLLVPAATAATSPVVAMTLACSCVPLAKTPMAAATMSCMTSRALMHSADLRHSSSSSSSMEQQGNMAAAQLTCKGEAA